MRSSLALAALALLAGCATQQGPVTPRPAAQTGLYMQSFGRVPAAKVQTLVVVLHGDAPFEKPDYHYRFAEAVVAAVPSSIAVGLLRPGYDDPAGHHSPGDRGNAAGDNYTQDRIAAVADAIKHLQRRYPNANTILVGHSGGAALAADLAGSWPDLLDGMVLVSCPCTLPEWRKHMKTVSPTPLWDQPVTSLDPIKLVGGIQPPLKVAVLVGADDQTTPMKYSRAYAEALSLRGIATDFRIVPNQGHDMLNDPEVMSALQRIAATLPRKR